MSKVFTITEGLENMGAIKTGGQGSVYKGRRTGEIITAIKLLPTPIINASEEDKNYKDFLNEVEKLKRVNEEPHPNVVTIISSGVSDTGNFPFIEMEYIEGPDLEDLLKPPHDPVFCVKDVSKVAEHLSNALSHCHKYGVKHGDIKSNNIKFNINTGNYVLLDFGLSVMSDEQRRTSLRRAGAIEFMAPEQNEGEILLETDVYSFGVILFELIAGRVPFPLNDKTESARNTVRLSHMETPVPDMLRLRMENLPAGWEQEKKDREMHVPAWLLETTYKCLEKEPKNRFNDGVTLLEHIEQVRNAAVKSDEALIQQVNSMRHSNKLLVEEVTALKKQFSEHQLQDQYFPGVIGSADIDTRRRSVSRTSFMVVLILAIAFAGLAAYAFYNKGNQTQQLAKNFEVGSDSLDSVSGSEPMLPVDLITGNTTAPIIEQAALEEVKIETNNTNSPAPIDTPKTQIADTTGRDNNEGEDTEQKDPEGDRYRVTSKAYFYTSPDESSRTNEYIIPAADVMVKALDDKGDFILVSFRDVEGETTKGWIRKKDVSKLN